MDWNPTQFFHDNSHPPSTPYALLILDQPINDRAFAVLRKHASFILCADGGANRYYDMMKSHGKESIDLPNAIVGDLDSITASTRSHYEKLHVPIIQDPDQYSTDFTKCLGFLRDWVLKGHPGGGLGDDKKGKKKELYILILGGLGGRVDQAFSQIHHLYTATRTETGSGSGSGVDLNLYLVSEESITFVLHPGKNTIYTPGTNRPFTPSLEETSPSITTTTITTPKQKEEGEYYLEENVGIIPLFGPTRITTHGFEWDVTDWPTEIGGQISTSNHIRADVVEVECRVPVLFTLELARRFKLGGRER